MSRLRCICVLFLSVCFSILVFGQQSDDAQATQSSDSVDVLAQVQQLKADVERLSQEVERLNNEVQRLQTGRPSTPTSTSTPPRPKPVQTTVTRTAAPVPAPPAVTAQTEESTPVTVLLFRDGRRIETRNYAIVGESVWVYSEQESKRYRLADLDVDGTKKVNSDRGVFFQIPPAR
jgi:hypothetical protein